MIQISDKTNCCGCTACYSICPQNCITMEADGEGFLYPNVNRARCVECGACERVCPIGKTAGAEKRESIYAAVQYKDEAKRSTSTAGGAFSLIADCMIDGGGIVYAVGYEEMVVCHKRCTDKENLQELRGSKYVQSTLKDTFREIKDLLREGRTVLFAGTPCQVHGLMRYVGQQDGLFTIDLLCLGVSSPRLFAEWIAYLNSKYQCRVCNVQFRNKHYGYSTPNVKVYFENGRQMDQKYDTRVHANLFFRHYNVRPACYECAFREIPRVSDFTIGDFTQIGSVNRRMDDDKGTSKLWIHTRKGKELFEKVKGEAAAEILDVQSSNIIGGPKKQIKRPENRELFFEDAQNMDYISLVSKWEPKRFKGELAGCMRPIINRFPFKKALFQYFRNRKLKNYQKNVTALNQIEKNERE